MFKRTYGYRPWLYDVSIDACRFLSKPTNAVAILLTNQVKNFTNFFDQKCPVSVICFKSVFFFILIYINFLFAQGTKIVDGFYLNSINLPLPTGQYMLQTALKFNEKLTIVTNLSFQIVENF